MAQGKNLVRYIGGRALQGAADAFVQATIPTGIVPEDGLGLEVVAFEFAFTGSFEALGADFSYLWSLSRDTQGSIVNLNNPDCIMCDGIFTGLTTSGIFSINQRHAYNDITGLFIVEPNVYFQFDSNGTGLVMGMDCRIYYKETALSEVDILRILQNV